MTEHEQDIGRADTMKIRISTLPPAEKMERHRMDLAAHTDWFVSFLVFLLILFGRAPLEPWGYIMVAVGAPSAIASMLKILGRKATAGSSATALLLLALPLMWKALLTKPF